MFSALLGSYEEGDVRKISFLLKKGLFSVTKFSLSILIHEYRYNARELFEFLFDKPSESLANGLLKDFSYSSPSFIPQEKISDIEVRSFTKRFLEEMWSWSLKKSSEKVYYRLLRTYVKSLSAHSSDLFVLQSSEPWCLIYLKSPLLETVLNHMKEVEGEIGDVFFKKGPQKNKKKFKKFLKSHFSLPRLYRKTNIKKAGKIGLSKKKRRLLKSYLVLGTVRDYVLEFLGVELRKRVREKVDPFYLLNFFYYFEALEARFENLKHYAYHRSLLLLNEDAPILHLVIAEQNINLLYRFSYLVGPHLFELDDEGRSLFDYYLMDGRNPRLLLALFEMVLEFRLLEELVYEVISSSRRLEDLITAPSYRYYREAFDAILSRLYEMYQIPAVKIFPLL